MQTIMSEPSLMVNIDQRGIASVTLNRPDKHNAFDDKVIAELSACFDQLRQHKSVRAMILAGAGKNFCAGADLAWMQRMADYSYEENLADANALAEMLFKLYSLPFPTIAQVTGSAFGGGVGLVAACNMAIGTKLCKFCLSEVKLGLIPATISPYLVEAIGARQAKRYFMTAEVMSARRARRLGLLNETVVEEELESTTEQVISALLKNGPVAVGQAKILVEDVQYRVNNELLRQMTSERIADIRTSAEGQEGLQAFLQKRSPAWRRDEE